jgi:sugar phosphate isomerase/epimerase
MTAPIALQLYTVREELDADFHGVIRSVSEIGYVGVEPSIPTLGISARRAADLFNQLDLVVPSVHAPLPIGEQADQVIDLAGALGCTRIVSGLGPEAFASVHLVRQSCGLFNEACKNAAARGMTVGLHNHWWEFERVEGAHVYEILLDHLDPRVFFQIDTYWVQTAGCDPAEVVRDMGSRCPLLHIKDGPATKDEPMVPIGQGVLDFRRIVRAAGENVEWMIVELDRAAMSMMKAVEISYAYLVREGMARGNMDPTA